MSVNVKYSPFEKLQACILYACSKDIKNEGKLDHIKLNKVLWYSDSAAYMATGKGISDARYIRKPNGPVARLMAPVMASLQKDEQVKAGKQFDPTRGMWIDTYEYIGNRDGTDILTAEEREYIDNAFSGVCRHETNAISERTHGEVWEIALNGEEIPLHAMFAERVGKITSAHVAMAFGS